MNHSIGSLPSKKRMILNQILIQGFVPILVNDNRDARKLTEAAVNAGCKVLECSCRRADAREIIPWIKKDFPHVAVLAATLVDSPRLEPFLAARDQSFLTVNQASDLGADALVSFTRFRADTYDRFGTHLVMIPGIHSANEALDQLDLGADLLKTSVLTVTGKEFISTVSGPTHNAFPLFISGGVTAGNVATFIQQGIAVAAAGFDVLLPDKTIADEDLTHLGTAAVANMLTKVREARVSYQLALATAVKEEHDDVITSAPWYRNPAT